MRDREPEQAQSGKDITETLVIPIGVTVQCALAPWLLSRKRAPEDGMVSRAARLLVLVLSFRSSLAAAADWPQWRGPQRNGISTETGLLKEWPAEGPKLLWQVKDIGNGFSTPAIVGERLYLMSNQGTDDEFVQ